MNEPTTPPGTDVLPCDVADLLAAVVEALDIPLPSFADADERAHHRLLADRAGRTVIALRGVLDNGHDLDTSAQWLRTRTAEEPVTYTPWKRPEQDGGAA